MTGARRVYVIDDDPQVLDSTAFLLSTLGYECMTFSAADEFLGRAPNLPLGCVLTDLRMPVIDGFELASKIGELGLDWPLLMMTSDHNADVTRRAARHGIATVLPKPVRSAAVAGALDEAFSAFDA